VAIISVLKSYARRIHRGAKYDEARVDLGGGDIVTAEVFAPAGDDSQALPGDYPVVVTIPRTGGAVIVGYVDPKNAGETDPGERRIYARNAGTGEIVAELRLFANGRIRGQNSAGVFELHRDGTFEANGAKMLVDGDVVTSDGVSLRNHTHPQGADGGGNSEQDTDPPNAG